MRNFVISFFLFISFASTAQKKWEDFIGFNGNKYIPLDLYKDWDCVMREYDYSMCYMRDSDTLFKFSPTYRPNFFDNDKHYESTKKEGITTMPLTFRGPENIYKPSYSAAGVEWDMDAKTIQFGADPLLPASYISMGRLAFQFGARYGRSVVPINLLKIDQTDEWNTINEKKTAQNILTYFEFGNELDRWWGPVIARWSPDEIAAYMSCIYDGHEGTLGPGVGIKNADPNAKFVMPGLADINLDIIKQIDAWAKKNRRDKKFPADVINFHIYPSTVVQHSLTNAKGLAPELWDMKAKLKDFSTWIRANIPKVEIFYSEFGYDSNKKSPFGVPLLTDALRAKAAFPQDSWQLQGSLLLRCFLEGMASTRYVDRMVQYQIHNETHYNEKPELASDVNLNPDNFYDPYSNGMQFQTSGLVLGEYAGNNGGENFGKKTSWYMINNATDVLKGCIFIADSSKQGYRDYVFSNGLNKIVRVVWKPTQDGSELKNKTLYLRRKNAHLRDLQSDSKVESVLPITSGMIHININEMPKFIYSTYLPGERDIPNPIAEVIESDGEINVVASLQVSVYPNPAEQELFIKTQSPFGEKKYTFFNVLGEEILSLSSTSNILKIDIGSWKKGYYNLKVEQGEHIDVSKVIVQ